TPNAGLQGIAVSPVDNSTWFAEAYAGKIGHLTCKASACAITEYGPPSGLRIQGVIQVAVDKNGIVWFTIHSGNEFGSFNPSTGDWNLFPIGYCSDSYVADCWIGLPNALSLDSDGRVGFSEHTAGGIIEGLDVVHICGWTTAFSQRLGCLQRYIVESSNDLVLGGPRAIFCK